MPNDIANEILELERAALDRWGRGDPSGYLDLYASDVTYFDPLVGKRIDGLAAMRAYYEPWIGRISVPRYVISNPCVVASTDLAVLTYNLVNYQRTPDGGEAMGSCWNSTAAYRRTSTRWEIVHAHWSFTRHEAFRTMTPEQSEGG